MPFLILHYKECFFQLLVGLQFVVAYIFISQWILLVHHQVKRKALIPTCQSFQSRLMEKGTYFGQFFSYGRKYQLEITKFLQAAETPLLLPTTTITSGLNKLKDLCFLLVMIVLR